MKTNYSWVFLIWSFTMMNKCIKTRVNVLVITEKECKGVHEFCCIVVERTILLVRISVPSITGGDERV